jgi:hypothetical protein
VRGAPAGEAALATRASSRRDMWPLVLAAALLSFPVALFLWRRSLGVTFFALSGDDFHRALYGWQAAQGDLLPSDLWPPLQFWVQALVLRVYPHPLSVPYLVNLTAATGALAALLALGRGLGLGRGALLVALALAATVPWFVWLSLSGMGEPLFLLGIVAAYAGVAWWRAHGRGWGLWLAAAGLAAAGMVRFDAWGHAVPFSLGVGWLWWRSRPARRHAWLAAAALPWAFPLFWLAWQQARHGNPFYFSQVTRDFWLGMHGPLPLADRLLWQPRDLWLVAGVMLPLGLGGLWLLRRGPGVALLSLMWLASFALLVQSTLGHAISQAHTQRLVVVHALLLAPGAALALARVAERGWVARATAAAVLLALLVSRVGAVPAYPNGLAQDSMLVGSHVGALRGAGDLRPGERIMVEVLFWDYIILHVLMNDPGAVDYDREPTTTIVDGVYVMDDVGNPSVLALPPERLRPELERRKVRVVVAHSERAADGLRPIARETEHAGRFRVFVLN